jgi:ribose/xylose/arabinose/galactoside ABC-type transport system permease subunit
MFIDQVSYLRFKHLIIMTLLKYRMWLIITNLLYYLFLLSSISIFKHFFDYNNIYFFIFVFSFYPIIVWLLFVSIHNSYLGGSIGAMQGVSDVHGWWYLPSYVPFIGPLCSSILLHRELNELQNEMDKQGVTDINYFKSLSRRCF